MDRHKITLLALAAALLLLSALQHVPRDRHEYVLLSVDTERDLMPVLNTSRGLDEGLRDYLIELLSEQGVHASFFVTGRVAKQYPDLLREIVLGGNELCGHAYEHEDFTALSYEQTRAIVLNTVEAIQNASGTRISCFRAPYQRTTPTLERVLSELGFESEGSHDRAFPSVINGTNLTRITSAPLFYPSSTYPRSWTNVYDETLRNQENNTDAFIVIGFHPWELVPLPLVSGFEEYTRPAGDYTRTQLEGVIAYAKSRGASFITFREAGKILHKKCSSRLLFCV